MYGAKGASLINTVARQSALSKQLAAGHSSKSTAFLTNLSTRNVSAGKLSYTTSRASQHLNKSSQQDDNQQQEYRRMHRSNSGWHQLAKISQLPTASRHQQARFNHQMAAANGKDESIVPTEVNNRIMQAHKAHDPERVVAEFVAGRTAGAPLSTQTYDAVLDAYGTLRKHNQSVKAMCEVYDDMIANGVHPTSHAYATLLKSLCNRDNEVNRLVNTLRHKKARYGTKIDSLGALENESNDNVERAVALFQRAVQEQQTEDFDVDLYNRMLNMLSVSGNTKDALYIYETLEESATAKPDSQTFTMLINMYGYAGDMSKAHECFSEYLAMSSHLPKHDPAHVYNAYVFAHVDAGDFDGAMEVVRTIRANNVRVNIRPYNKIINGAASKENMAVIEQVLEELRQDPSLPKPDANTYGPLLSMYARQGDYDKATEQLERLLEHDLSRQYGRIADYVCLCRSQKQPDRALDVLKRANTRGMSVDVDLIREVLNGYIESGRYTHVDQAFETLAAMYAKTNFIDNKSPLTHMASDLAIKNNHLKISVSLLRQMYKYSVRMSPPLASNILQQYDAAKKDTAQWKEFSSSADSRDYGILYEALFRTIDERDQFADRIFQLLDDVRILNIPLSMPNLYVRVMTHLNRLKKPDAQARWQKEFEPFLQATEEAAASPSASTSSASSVTSAANMESGLQSGAALGLAVKGDLKGAIGVLEQQILGKGLLPKPNVVRDMIQQATRYKDIASAQRIYDLTKDSLGQWVANSSNNSQQRHAVQNVLNSMLIAYARAEDVPRAKEFYDELRARDMVPDGDGYASLLACTPNSTADESTDALDIYDEAMKHHVRPTVYFYNVIMSKLAKCRKIELVLQFFDEMKRNRVAPGSTEWVEDHDWLKDKAVTYINVDTAVSGPHFVIQASPSLNQLIYEVTSLVQDPRTGGSVYDAWAEFTNRTLTPSSKPYIGQLGSGSDFVPFLDHLGISSISLSFSGDYGVYHSNYDSFHWMEKFGDPGFHYHATMTKIWGLMALRLADSPILPLHPVDYADALNDYVDYLVDFTTTLTIDDTNGDRSFPLLRKAVHKLRKVAVKLEKRLKSLESQVYSYSHLANVPKSLTSSLQKVNDRLAFFERGLIDPEGIQNREWFKHIAYAPGLWTGYSSQVFPAITDALEDNDEELAKYKEERAAQCIRGAADSLK